MQHNKVGYIVGFAAAVCAACSLLVSSTAVVLKEKQDVNKLLYKQQMVLDISGLIDEGDTPLAEEVNTFFEERIDVVVLNMETNVIDDNSGIDDPIGYNQLKASKDAAMSYAVKRNAAKVSRIPNHITVYIINDENGDPSRYVLPVEGMGLWGTMYGFVALDNDLNTIQGLTFYDHKETPGLGAEIGNPIWKAKWPGRLARDDSGTLAIRVIKGPAGTPEEAPHHVDGLSGATLTSNGVTNLLHFWLGDEGFGPYLKSLGGTSTTEGSDA